jgi:predicted O-methyltransferase YrrM
LLNKIFPVIAYLKYWLFKEDKYSLQSPFLFRIYQELLIFLSERKESDLDIEEIRNDLLNSAVTIKVDDFGAGSKKVNTQIRRISDITKYSTSSRKFAQVYQYFCMLTPAKTVLELGTCMGLTSRYLSRITSGTTFTFEGSEEIKAIAMGSESFENLNFIQGKINETLPGILRQVDHVDFALIDANHTYDGTMNAYNQIKEKVLPTSILAIGDIHWSPEMETAWKEISNQEEVKLSLDFFECGIIFFDSPVPKNHFILSI